MIKVVNFPFCNVTSLFHYMKSSGFEYNLLDSPDDLKHKDTLILPGVGTFEEGMKYLTDNNLVLPIKNHAASGGKVIGICLGMQLLLQYSKESPGCEGLSIIPGICTLLPSSSSFRVPHIGWNEVSVDLNCTCIPSLSQTFSQISESDFYFVHSYVAQPTDSANRLAFFEHPLGPQVASIAKDNVFGFQFHPEKSGPAGYALLNAFLA